MRSLVICCLVGVFGFATMAQAASDHSNNGNGQASAQSNAGGNGNGNAGGNGNTNGNSDGHGNAGSGSNGHAGNSHGAASKSEGSPSSSVGATTASDQNSALKAVTAGKALPLEALLKIVQQIGLGRVIDAKLVSVKGQLVYRLVFLNDTGVSRRAYYAADTGKPFRFP